MFLKNTKIGPLFGDESIVIQKYLFASGFRFRFDDKKLRDCKYLYLYDEYITHGKVDDTYTNHKNKEYCKYDLINLISSEKPEIEPFHPLRVEELIVGQYYKCSNGVILQWFEDKQHVLRENGDYKYIDGNFTDKVRFTKATIREQNKLRLHQGKELLTINTNKDEKRTKIDTEYRREKTGTAITSNCTREVATASRLIGNTIQNRVCKTRFGEFKIIRKAISF